MDIALILLAFTLNNLVWMVFFYHFLPERKIKPIKMPKIKIKDIPNMLHKEDERIPLASADPKEILKSLRNN